MCGRTSLWAVLVMLLILQPAMEKIDVITCKELKWNQAFKTKQLQPVSGLFHATVLIFGIILFFFHASVSPLQWMLPFLPSSTFQPISIRSTHSIIFAEPCTVVVLRTAHQRISVEIIEYSRKWAQIQYHESQDSRTGHSQSDLMGKFPSVPDLMHCSSGLKTPSSSTGNTIWCLSL